MLGKVLRETQNKFWETFFFLIFVFTCFFNMYWVNGKNLNEFYYYILLQITYFFYLTHLQKNYVSICFVKGSSKFPTLLWFGLDYTLSLSFPPLFLSLTLFLSFLTILNVNPHNFPCLSP